MAHTDYVQVTDIAFLEFSGSQPRSLLKLFKQMGFVQAGRHVDRPITLHTQGHIHFISNPSSGGNAELFRAVHYRGACAMGFKVADSQRKPEQKFPHTFLHNAPPGSPDSRIFTDQFLTSTDHLHNRRVIGDQQKDRQKEIIVVWQNLTVKADKAYDKCDYNTDNCQQRRQHENLLSCNRMSSQDSDKPFLIP